MPRGPLSVKPRSAATILLGLLLVAPLLSGCISSLLPDDAPSPSADLQVWPNRIQQGESITLDARSSDAISGVIIKFTWDFGDGSIDETLVGFTSHRYNEWGQYEVSVTVENDKGGTDTVTSQISVNGLPVIDISMPKQVKAGDIAVFDASTSYDPEGGELDVSWDLDWSKDSDGDGDNKNDVDFESLRVELPTGSSGQIIGSLTITDEDGGTAQTPWNLEILTRQFQVEWTERTFEFIWDNYTEQGGSWSISQNPGEEGMLVSFEALLELDRDLIEPQDNFTLHVDVEQAGWSDSEKTTSSNNLTSNESASAELQRDGLNSINNVSIISSDTEAALLDLLLNPSGSGFGAGTWLWSISVEQADPDAFFGQGIDPDTGNDWTLTVSFVIMVPTLTEIAQ
ncbi:MAG: PKD domain-containing protein [Candidatus Poseidoniales archaeon]|jgi:PKD repeat protein